MLHMPHKPSWNEAVPVRVRSLVSAPLKFEQPFGWDINEWADYLDDLASLGESRHEMPKKEGDDSPVPRTAAGVSGLVNKNVSHVG